MSLAEDFQVRLKFDYVLSHSAGLLWVFYNSPFSCSTMGEGAQFLSLFIQHPGLVSSVSFSAVNAATTGEERQALWAGLLQCKPSHGPWLVCGDFNVVIKEEEKKGERPFTVAEATDFVAFISSAGLVDGGFSGSRFTWCNNCHGPARIWKHLDRLLRNVDCFDAGLAIGVAHLERHPSDHAPLLLFAGTRLDGPRGKFFEICSKGGRGCWKVREKIIRWGVHAELQQAQASLRRALAMEESLWRQRARVKWLAVGDRNTKFFHSVVKQRRMNSIIHRIQKPDGGWVNEDTLIGEEAVRYFSSLFSLEDAPGIRDVPDVIPRLVSMEDNERLEEVPSLEEVWQTVREMDGNSAAGPDGFSGRFFSAAWEIVGSDVYNAVQSFFCGSEFPRLITATSIVLLPKVQQPKDFSQFRLISLCNFVNKIFSKILVRWLAPILPKIISPNQSGFVRGRSISDNYLLAQEVIAGIKRKARGGNVMFKFDMMKAYDRMMWSFLIKVLHSFGFGERWIDMVWRVISNVWFSVIVNGSLCRFFKSARGLRQGDPLSPALFIIGTEVLSWSLSQLVHRRGFQGFRVPRSCPTSTHLGYVDDVLIFSSATATSLRLVMRVLEDYEASSGQLVNKSKSCFLGHTNLGRPRMMVIQRATGFKSCSFPIRYLGYPLYYGRRKKEYFAGLCQAVVSKIESWKNRLLSAGGRIVLLKHVLSALPVYLLMAASPPKSVFKKIEGPSQIIFGVSQSGVTSVIGSGGKIYVCQGKKGAWGFDGWRIYIALFPSSYGGASVLCHLFGQPLLRLSTARRCGCCPSPKIETVEHVFATGEMVSRVWHFFGDPVLPCRLGAFLCRDFGVGPPGILYASAWSRPSGDFLKLNTDGYSKGNPSVSGGGGILRDGGGHLLLAFSCYFGHATSLQAEVPELLFGVKLCVQCGFGRLDVDLDSLVLVHILQGKASCPWGVYQEIQ
ncbi:uncharacterized protein LOC113752040 [Coffea eugenioides]|uniref:uncharacterized protein LOC113752040 n=1 Tax=Coffea eugenioides TaxID=49369 RepID=UPI000F615D0D|nr:uncharacterized protein LOC113752040 [Coffea eugenioides]